MTYTFPYMIPLAIAFAAYLRHHERLVALLTAASVVFYMAVTFFCGRSYEPRRVGL